MALTKFVINEAGIRRIAVSPQMVAMVEHYADKGAEQARAIAPVGETGDYQEGIEGQAGIENGTAKGRINGRDWKSHWIEFGTTRMAAQACLRRGAEAAGLRIRRSAGQLKRSGL